MPLPRLVLPTAAPPFSLGQSCHPRRSHPIGADLPHPAHRAGHATHPARRLLLPTALTAASRSKARGTRPAENATPLRFAESKGCLRNTPGSVPTVGLGCLADAAAQEAMAQSTPTARPSTASAASSWQKLNSPTASHVSSCCEAESIYETSSSKVAALGASRIRLHVIRLSK